MKPYFRILVFLMLPVAVQAAPIYKWIDQNGQVHFSDVPVGVTGESQQTHLHTELSGSVPLPEDSPWTIQNQLDYLEERKRQLAQERRKEKRLALEQQAIEAMQQQQEQPVEPAIAPPVVVVPRSAPWFNRRPVYPGEQPRPQDQAARLSYPVYSSPYHSVFRETRDAIRREATGNRVNPMGYPGYPGPYNGGYSLDYLHSGDHHRFNLMLRDRY